MTTEDEDAAATEVLAGLARVPKQIHSKFFYDQRGSELFDRICELEEYYLTRTELAIMRAHAVEMAALLGPRVTLVEFGSGSSIKTPLLLDALEEPAAYVPIDISGEHLEATAKKLTARYPEIEVLPLWADYTDAVKLPATSGDAGRRAVYFPGSTVGNFTPAEAKDFLRRVATLAGLDGALLIGVDLDKDPDVLHRAYNDAAGVTAEFNLNLLARFNRELGADFDLRAFRHHALYNQGDGRIEMYLISERPQTVRIGETAIRFEAGEKILTEYSYKYSLERFRRIGAEAGFEVRRVWTDDDQLFSVQYLEVAR
ncbi:MAG: L-histidine N(alpha)-methyltransferase [bacterium]|nr:L-histidine N(alpha)-methyltransferase [bacterium]